MKPTYLLAGATVLLALLQGGCASCPSGGAGCMTVSHCGVVEQPQSRHYSHKYKPRFAHKTYTPSPCNKQAPFYGFHTTCWSAWPAGWQNCELPCGSGGDVLPGELDFAEPVEPLRSGQDAADQVDQGDGNTSPSDVPPPAEPTLPDPAAAAETPSVIPEEDSLPMVNPTPPADALEQPLEDMIESMMDPMPEDATPGLEDAPSLEAPPALEPAPSTPPTSSRPRPLRSASRRVERANTATIVEVEDGLQAIEVPSLKLEAPAQFDDEAPRTTSASRQRGTQSAVSRTTVTIVEVSAAADIEPLQPATGRISDRVEPAAPQTPKSKVPTAQPGPVRHHLSDDADEEIRPVNWIDTFIETAAR